MAEKKRIFIFEAQPGDVLAEDIVLSDGHLALPSGTVLDMDSIAKVSSFHILEIDVFERTLNDVASEIPTEHHKEILTYYDKIKQRADFERFHNDYVEYIDNMKTNIHDIVTKNIPIDQEQLLDGLKGLLDQSKGTFHLFDMLHSMRNIDDLTYVHCINVSLIASIIGQWLNFSEEDIDILSLAGLLHDIGKLLIPRNILTKPDKLTAREFEIMKTHVNKGYDKLKDQALDSRIKEACLLHHERSDGSGYPFNLRSDKIPEFAKIIAIADVYDAMTSARIYRESICPFEVTRKMEEGAFTIFDPKYLLPFLSNVVGTYLHNDVLLSNGQRGEVILINQNALSRPIVKCGNEYIDLSKKHDVTIARIL